MRTRATVAVLCWTALASAAPPPTSAPAAAPFVVFHAPAGAGPAVAAARDAISRVAATSGSAFIDLTPAPAPPPSAPTLRARAIEAYDALRLDDAEAALDSALGEARATGAAGLEPSELSDLLLYRALVHTQRSNAARAWDDLVRCLTVDPARLLDPARFPPKTVQSFDRAAAQVRAAAHGKLAVAAPPACHIFIDARDVGGTSPELPFGEHYVRVECPGERPAGAVVVLGEAEQSVGLPRAPFGAPEDGAIVALARERGAAEVVIVNATLSAGGPPTLRLTLRETRTGELESEMSVALPAGGVATEDARLAAERLVGRRWVLAGSEPAAPPVAAPTRWYEKPWLWAIIGGAVTAAVLLPFAFDQGSASGFTVRPTGGVWP